MVIILAVPNYTGVGGWVCVWGTQEGSGVPTRVKIPPFPPSFSGMGFGSTAAREVAAKGNKSNNLAQ